MSHYFLRASTATFVYVCATQTAFADLTAKEVWSEWNSYLSGVGYTVSGTESVSGNTLTISDFSISMQLPDGVGMFALDAAELGFTENGDGTVAVSLPETMPIRVETAVDGEEEVNVEIGYSVIDGAILVSGSSQDMTFDYKAAQIEIALASLTVDGETIPSDIGRFAISLANIASTTRVLKADMRSYSQSMNADSLTYDMAFNDPDSDDMGHFTGALQGVVIQGSGAVPLELDTSDFKKMLADGFGFDGSFSYASGNSNIAAKGDGEDFSYTSTSQGGLFGVAMDASHVAYDVSQKGTAISVTSAELPFPVSIEMAETGFSFDMPVTQSDQQQPFSFGLKLVEFSVPEMLWGMVDPSGAIPHDPATIIVEMAGKATVLADFLDPATAMMMEETGMPPGELNALTIKELLISAAGAKLTGNGDFTFDNADMESFDGIPAPTGAATVQLVGANTLMDTLIQMGLLSDQDAMGARMMMGMFAVPGDGPDTLESTVEFTEKGHILANGQRLK